MQDRTQVAEFIGTHAGELARMAREAGLETLAYLLEMARLEANDVAASRGDGPRQS
jgi:hypothetical protein